MQHARVVTARVSPDVAETLAAWAGLAGKSRSAYLRHLIETGGPPPARIDAQGVAELRRIGVMLRNFLRKPPANWTAQQTDAFFAALRQIEQAAARLSA